MQKESLLQFKSENPDEQEIPVLISLPTAVILLVVGLGTMRWSG